MYMDKERVESALEFAKRKQDQVRILNTKIEMTKEDIKAKAERVDKVAISVENHKRGSDVVQECLNVFNEQYLNRIKRLLDSALKFVFYDCDYEFVFKSSGKEIEFCIMDHQKKLEKPLSRLGGGLRVVISTFLQLYIIEERGFNKVLCLDESLYAISEKYREKFYHFLKAHSKENEFYILAISHDESANKYMEHVVKIGD